MSRGVEDPVFEATIAAVEALIAEWVGPGPRPPHAVAHQDPGSGLVTFHLRGLPAHLEYLLGALRACAPASDPVSHRRTLYVTRGLPGCGKTTRARRWVAEAPLRRARINRDDLREQMFAGRTGAVEHEHAVTLAQHAAIEALLADGCDVVADDTNLNPVYLDALESAARKAGAGFVVWDMTDVPIETCIGQDAVRAARGERHVGETVIRDLNSAWLSPAGGRT